MSRDLPAPTLEHAFALHQSGRLAEAAEVYRALLARNPQNPDALHYLGVLCSQTGDARQALDLIGRAVALRPNSAMYRCSHANTLFAMARLDEALADYGRALALEPRNLQALINRGAVLQNLKRFAEALADFERALVVKPDFAEALHARGLVLHALGRFDDALKSYDRALMLNSTYVEALINRGATLGELKRFGDELASYEKAIALNPGLPEAWNNRAIVLLHVKRLAEALESVDRALVLKPDYAAALSNRGNVLQEMGRLDEALASYAKALAVDPGNTQALNNRGATLQKLKRFDEALGCFDRALLLKPDDIVVLNNRGNALQELGRFDEALANFDRALSLKPDLVEALNNRAALLKELKRYDEAVVSYDKALALKPDLPFVHGTRLFCKLAVCDWRELDDDFARLSCKIDVGEKASPPFPALIVPLTAAQQQKCARAYMQAAFPPMPSPPFAPRVHPKIRLGYFSADYHNHATSYLMAELFECHDRARFELTAFSFGPAAKDAMRARLEKTFDKFIDARALSDSRVAGLARELEIDIAVGLGFSDGNRPGIFALRAAPVQINYLAYPGTAGAEYIDYLIADPTVIPPEHLHAYDEKIAYLPHTYQVNDRKRVVAERLFTRAECGLPESAFVFCSFNNNFKILPYVFDVWMRLLAQVEGSVLWLLEDNASAANRLREQAQARGIKPERLIFAKRMDLPEHLARHRLADLFLDTLPCNAHTTASDALWGGLPVLTVLGETFAGRVAASLLRAADLPELVTHSLEEYESLALNLAREPRKLTALKEKLEGVRLTCALFDTARFTRHVESAYLAVWERHTNGLAPDHIYIDSKSMRDHT